MSAGGRIVAVDVGGTFTDVVAVDNGRIPGLFSALGLVSADRVVGDPERDPEGLRIDEVQTTRLRGARIR